MQFYEVRFSGLNVPDDGSKALTSICCFKGLHPSLVITIVGPMIEKSRVRISSLHTRWITRFAPEQTAKTR